MKVNRSVKLYFLLASIAILIFFSSTKIIDGYGEQYTEEGFQRSLVAFAIAKGLNGAISAVQGTEVALEPAGVGVILTPGQILDPVNDLVERFSTVMLISATSLGIQSVLLTIFSSESFLILIAMTLFVSAFFLIKNNIVSIGVRSICYRMAILFIILRFFIPMMAIANDAMYTYFLESKYTESQQQLSTTDQAITSLSRQNQNINDEVKNLSWYESLSKDINTTLESMNVSKRVEQLQGEADAMTTHIIDLIVVFTLQTILFPLVFIWLTMKLIKQVLSFQFVQ